MFKLTEKLNDNFSYSIKGKLSFKIKGKYTLKYVSSLLVNSWVNSNNDILVSLYNNALAFIFPLLFINDELISNELNVYSERVPLK